MTDPERADRCAACGLSQIAFDAAADALLERYEAITRDAVVAERERVLAIFENGKPILQDDHVDHWDYVKRLARRARGAE